MRRKAVTLGGVFYLLFGLISSGIGQEVTAGRETVEDLGAPDGWTNILYINEDAPFDFTGGQTEGVLTHTNFWAANPQGMYTPFVAEPMEDDGAIGDDFIVRAIGTTRVGGTDYACAGEYRFPFHDTEEFTVQDGWLAGFLSSDPAGDSADARSPIPFVGNAGIEGWLTGTATAGTGLPAIELGEAILEGGSQTFIDGAGLRDYQFNVQAEPGNVQPPLDPGGRVGEACPPPPEEKEGFIGAPTPLVNGGSVDGWSGVPVMYQFELPPGETVETVRYYVADDRVAAEDEAYVVVPLIVKQEDGSVEDGEGFLKSGKSAPRIFQQKPANKNSIGAAWRSLMTGISITQLRCNGRMCR